MDDEDFLRDSFELLMTTLNCKVKTVSRVKKHWRLWREKI